MTIYTKCPLAGRVLFGVFFVLFEYSTANLQIRGISAVADRPWTWQIQGRRFAVNSSQKSEKLRSILLQVRGGSDYRGDDRNYGNYRDDYYGRDKRPKQETGYYDEYYDRPYDQGARGRSEYDEYGKYSSYDDREPPSPLQKEKVQRTLSSLPSKIKNGDRRIGIPLLGLGVVFTMMGISLFFNKALMRLGNLMFIAGVPTTIGPKRTAGYFFQPQKTRATACLFAGIFLVFVGWPIFGIALEVFGILNLFGNMFPMFWAIFKNMPIVSSILKSTDAGNTRTRPPPSYRDRGYESSRDPYYEDRQGYEDYRDDEAEPFY